MTDMYVYQFKWLPGTADEGMLSTRHSTLQAIRGIGEPIMESQIVVDDTELDADGFVRLQSGSDPYAANDLTVLIDSLERRALSRDIEASHLNDGASGKDKYMLSLESRELRKQARALKTRRAASQTYARNDAGEAARSDCFEGSPVPG